MLEEGGRGSQSEWQANDAPSDYAHLSMLLALPLAPVACVPAPAL